MQNANWPDWAGAGQPGTGERARQQGTRFVDFDNDGWLDLFFANGHVTDSDRVPRERMRQPIQLFRSREGFFETVRLGAAGAPVMARGAAFGDYDNDGWADVLVANLDGPALLLRNEGGRRRPRRHWIGLELVGRRSNRDGLGARVALRAGGVTQVAEARTAGGVFSSNDPRLRFRLDAASRVEEVLVEWPSGRKDRLTDLRADRYVRIEEGEQQREMN